VLQADLMAREIPVTEGIDPLTVLTTGSMIGE
jgi:hypothetical protein